MKYAIFDFDGTIADSMGMWRNLANAFLIEHGYPFQDDLKNLENDKWEDEFIQIAFNRFGFKIEPEYFYKWLSEYSVNQYKEHIQLKNSVYEYLERLKNLNVKMCICSSTSKFMMLPALERLDLLKFFDFTCHCREFGKEKNEPDIFFHCMKKLGASSPKEVAVFEDAYYAANTAHKAGFFLAAVQDDTEPKQDLLKNICNIYITDYSQADTSIFK